MTLLIAVPLGALLGLAFGSRLWVLAVAGAVWYACLALQTAYLAHPGRPGFFGVDALPAVQGAGFGQYWLAQPVIAALMVGLLVGAARLRRSAWSSVSGTATTSGNEGSTGGLS